MVTNDKMKVYTSLSQRIKEISFCPIKAPVIDALSYIKAIAKMDNGINIVAIESCKERIDVELLEVVMENLRAFTDTKVGVSNKSDLTPCHTSEDKLHQNYTSLLVDFQVHQEFPDP